MEFNLQKILDEIELEQYAEELEQRRRDKKLYKEQKFWHNIW